MPPSPAPRLPAPRLPAIDIARTAALAAMVVFHVGRDMDVLGLVEPGATFTPGWMWAARLIAGSFVFLAGVSLWLAHGRGIRWGAYLRRLAVVIAAAAAVSIATYVTFPGAWVRFGILHSIAASSIAGLAFLRLPWPITAAVGLGLAAAGGVALDWDGPVALVVGLTRDVPPMMDWEPLAPWTGPFLLGLAAARALEGAGWLAWLRGWPDGALWRALGWPGRHSLAVYLIHQPVIVGVLLGWQRLGGGA